MRRWVSSCLTALFLVGCGYSPTLSLGSVSYSAQSHASTLRRQVRNLHRLIYSVADVDDNSRVTREEAVVLGLKDDSAFDLADVNHNGTIGFTEYDTDARLQSDIAAHCKAAAEVFGALDKDQDHLIHRSEYQSIQLIHTFYTRWDDADSIKRCSFDWAEPKQNDYLTLEEFEEALGEVIEEGYEFRAS